MKGDAKKSMWKPEEDLILKTYVETHGEGKWSSVSKKLGLHRDGKSCRLRWKNYLRPDIKHGRMSKDEEDLIIRMHKLLGNRWSLIAGRLPGRTDNEVKNYWNTHLSKKRVCRAKRKSTSSKVDDHKNPNEKSARTVRFKEGDNDHDPHKNTQERPNAQVENAQEENNQNDDKEDEKWSILGGQLLMESETGNSNRDLLDTSFMDEGNGSMFMIPNGDEAFENQPWEDPWTDTSHFLFDALENEWERAMFFP